MLLPNPKSIVTKMKERIKRVSKGYWLLVALLLIADLNSEPSWLMLLTWAVVIGYLAWKMSGGERK